MVTRTLIALLFLLCVNPIAFAQESDVRAMFEEVKKALNTSDEKLFRRYWHDAGYETNLVGGSGLEGASAFRQGSKKGWFLRPDLDHPIPTGRAQLQIYTCDVVTFADARVVDRVWALPVLEDGRYQILGAGEKVEEVQALAGRWAEEHGIAKQAPTISGIDASDPLAVANLLVNAFQSRDWGAVRPFTENPARFDEVIAANPSFFDELIAQEEEWGFLLKATLPLTDARHARVDDRVWVFLGTISDSEVAVLTLQRSTAGIWTIDDVHSPPRSEWAVAKKLE